MPLAAHGTSARGQPVDTGRQDAGRQPSTQQRQQPRRSEQAMGGQRPTEPPTGKILVWLWSCFTCGYNNFQRNLKCRACLQKKQRDEPLVQQLWWEHAIPAGAAAGTPPEQERRARPAGARHPSPLARRTDGPVGADGNRPLLSQRAQQQEPLRPARDLPPLHRRPPHQRPPLSATQPLPGAANRWSRPPRLDGVRDQRRLNAPGALDGLDEVAEQVQDAGDDRRCDDDGFQTALNGKQRKKQRQRAARKAAMAAQPAGYQQSAHDGHRDMGQETGSEASEANDDAMDTPVSVPPPFEVPPLTRLQLVERVGNLEGRIDKLRGDHASPRLVQRAEKRLEEAKKLMRQAGGATEKRMLFSIMGEDDRIRKLQASAVKSDAAIDEAQRQISKLQKRIENLRIGRQAIERRLENAREKRAYLSTQNAAEAIPAERTTQVHQALSDILSAAAPNLAQQAAVVVDYFRKVAPLATQGSDSLQDADLSECDTVPEESDQAILHAEQLQQGQRRPRGKAQGDAFIDMLPQLPDPLPCDLGAASELVERLRRQRMQAIGASFGREPQGPGDIPTLTGPQVADRYDVLLKVALENFSRVKASQREDVPTPCIAAAASMGDKASSPPNAVSASGGQSHGEASRSRHQPVHVGSSGDHGHPAETGPETPKGKRIRKTRWEAAGPSDDAGMSMPQDSPTVEQCPACGKGPLPEIALVGFCSCCAAVCGECSQGGTVEINSCLYCHGQEENDKQRAYIQHLEDHEAMDESEPRDSSLPQDGGLMDNALAIIGTLSESRTATRRSTPY